MSEERRLTPEQEVELRRLMAEEEEYQRRLALYRASYAEAHYRADGIMRDAQNLMAKALESEEKAIESYKAGDREAGDRDRGLAHQDLQGAFHGCQEAMNLLASQRDDASARRRESIRQSQLRIGELVQFWDQPEILDAREALREAAGIMDTTVDTLPGDDQTLRFPLDEDDLG